MTVLVTENTINPVIMSRCCTVLVMANHVMLSKYPQHVCAMCKYAVWIDYAWTGSFCLHLKQDSVWVLTVGTRHLVLFGITAAQCTLIRAVLVLECVHLLLPPRHLKCETFYLINRDCSRSKINVFTSIHYITDTKSQTKK